MTPALTFFIGLVLLILFGWYFATDFGPRKRLLATLLMLLLIAFSLVTIWPPSKKIQLGLDIQGGTSFLIRLIQQKGERLLTKNNLDQAVEVIRKRVDYFGGSEPVISPVGTDRILVQIPGLDPAKIIEARQQLSRVAKLEFRLVHPNSGTLISDIESGRGVVPPGYSIQTMISEHDGKKSESKLLVKKKADLLGSHVTRAGATYGQEGWEVNLSFDSQGAKEFGKLTEQVYNEHSAMAIVLDNQIMSAPGVRNGPIYGGNAQISGGSMDERKRAISPACSRTRSRPR